MRLTRWRWLKTPPISLLPVGQSESPPGILLQPPLLLLCLELNSQQQISQPQGHDSLLQAPLRDKCLYMQAGLVPPAESSCHSS